MNGDFLVAYSAIAYLRYGAHVVRSRPFVYSFKILIYFFYLINFRKFILISQVDLFNLMKIDMVVVGNHEFDFGPEKLHARIDESKFKWFATNVRERSSVSNLLFNLSVDIFSKN